MKLESYIMREAFAKKDWLSASKILFGHYDLPAPEWLSGSVIAVINGWCIHPQIVICYRNKSYSWSGDLGFWMGYGMGSESSVKVWIPD